MRRATRPEGHNIAIDGAAFNFILPSQESAISSAVELVPDHNFVQIKHDSRNR